MSIPSVNSQSTPLGRFQAAAHATAQQARTTPKMETVVNQAVAANRKNENTIAVTQETFQKVLAKQLTELQEQFEPLTSLFKIIEDRENRNIQSSNNIIKFKKELQTLQNQPSPSTHKQDQLTQKIKALEEEIEAREKEMRSDFEKALPLYQEIESRAATKSAGSIAEPYKQAKTQIEKLIPPLSTRKDLETLEKRLFDFRSECIRIDTTARESLMKWALRLEVADLSSSTFAVWKNNTSHLVMNSAPVTRLSEGWKGIRDFAKNPFNVVSTLTTGTSLVDATLRHLLSPSYGLVVAGGNLLATPFLASSSLSSAYEKGEYKKLATLGVSTLIGMGYPLVFQHLDESTKTGIREQGNNLVAKGSEVTFRGVVDYLIPGMQNAWNTSYSFATDIVFPALKQIPELPSAIGNNLSQISVSDDAKTVLYVTAGAVFLLGLGALGFYLYRNSGTNTTSPSSTNSTALSLVPSTPVSPAPSASPSATPAPLAPSPSAQSPASTNAPAAVSPPPYFGNGRRTTSAYSGPALLRDNSHAYVSQGQVIAIPADDQKQPLSPPLPALAPLSSAVSAPVPAPAVTTSAKGSKPAKTKKCASLRGRCTKISRTQVDLVAAGGFAIASVGAAALATPIAAGLGVVALTAGTRAAWTWWQGK